ncbi:hypothetical protein C1645_745885 [Glomus cerebriforme]|uniref:Aspartic peptidase domain-containing protein n=1 Tax=Glomus cerebriforme TaxID=658196 RepID=A0A397S437_9GLOM|nr:hypothetical protein C1645_745885 [Glomus cerebriforme]
MDVLITDIDARDLREVISDKLGIKYLSDSNHEHNGNVKGIVYGEFYRLICSLTVKIKEKIKFVHFIVDTGSKITYLSEDAMLAFGLSVTDPSLIIDARINNKEALVMLSTSHFSELNILGAQFLKSSGANLFTEYHNNSFTLAFPRICKISASTVQSAFYRLKRFKADLLNLILKG